MKNKKKFDITSLSNISSSLLAIVAGLLFGLLVLLAVDPSHAFKGFFTMVTAGIGQGGMKAVGNIFYMATPLMMTGLGVACAFKAGVFNIGGGGQFLVGGFIAILVAIKCEFLPGALRWIVPIIAAAIAGAIWAMIPGMLKAYRNVNVVISTVMMNYVGLYLVNFFIKEFVYNSKTGQSQMVPVEGQLPKGGLDKIFANSSINIGIIIAIVICILVHFLVNRTTFGYELKACGMNPNACKYAGIKEKKNIVMSMMLSGALIGIGGAFMYLSGKQIRAIDVQPGEGFTGIAIAIIAGNAPLGVILSAIFMAFVTVGGQYIQSYGFVAEIVDIITAAVIYFAAFTLIVKNFFDTWNRKKQAKENAAKEAELAAAAEAEKLPEAVVDDAVTEEVKGEDE